MVDEREPGRLRDERNRPRRARVRFQHVEVALVQRELEVEEAARAEPAGERACELADLRLECRAHRRRRDDAGGVAGVDARALDVLEDGGDPAVVAVAQDVDVELERTLEEAVDEGGAGELELVSVPARRACRGRRARKGRVSTGYPSSPASARASTVVAAYPHAGARRPSRARRVANRSRSSAASIADSGSPSSGTPASARPRARESGVCPPSETTTPRGRSSSTTSSTRSSVTGSRYRRSHVS